MRTVGNKKRMDHKYNQPQITVQSLPHTETLSKNYLVGKMVFLIHSDRISQITA